MISNNHTIDIIMAEYYYRQEQRLLRSVLYNKNSYKITTTSKSLFKLCYATGSSKYILFKTNFYGG